MKRSLQRRLTLMLGGAILLSTLVAAVASFVLAYAEAREFQDNMLRQIALLAAGAATTWRGGPATLSVGESEARISVIQSPEDPRPKWLAGGLAPGLHTLEANGERVRIFVQDRSPDRTTVVAQPTDTRDELATNSALRTLVPLLLLQPLIAWLIVRIVRSELAPVGRLASHLDAQSADRPRPLAYGDVPDEIRPFVQSINRLLERVVELMGQQRRFIADAAHELRSPLTALSLQVQNLKQAGSLSAMRERVQPLQAGIERARKLAEQLLYLARAQTGGTVSKEVDVSAMARELIAEHLPAAEAKGIDLGLDEATPITLLVDGDALRVILRNALENAIKYTPGGGEVTLRLHRTGDSDVIEVADNGPGIPVAEREHAFDPFYRVPGTTGEGSGLGLAIAREAAVTLGASVSLLDRPDGPGLVFRYQQPARK